MERNHLTTDLLPETERPYEKLESCGAASLTDAELVAILIRSGTRTENSLSVAQRLILQEGQGRGVLFLTDATVEELRRVPGIGRVKALCLKAAVELGRRATRGNGVRRGERILDPETLTGGVLDEMRLLEREEIWAMLIDVRGRLIRTLRFSSGGIAAAVLLPRDLFRDAVRSGATSLILAHNHPSGDPEPSEEDVNTTSQIREAGELIGVRLLDHIVMAAGGSVSMKRRGLV